MNKILAGLKANFSPWTLGVFLVVDLFNPLFKKYDYGAEYPLVLAFGVLLVFLAVVEFKRAREIVSIEKIFLLIFGLLVVLSFAFSQTKNLGFSEVLAFLEMIVFYLIYAGRKLEWKERFLRIVKIILALAVILGFVFYFTLENVRMFGPFFNILHRGNNWPNAFALFLLMTWPILLLSESNFSKAKISSRALLLVFTFAALLLTFSRGASLVLVGQLVILIIYFLKRIKKKHVFTGLTVILLAIGIFFGSNYIRSLDHKVIDVEQRVSFSNTESQTSKQERLEFWQGALKLALEKPFFGWGPFSFRYAYNPIQKTFLANADHPHNIFLKIAAENGIPAMLFFAAFLVSILVIVIKRFKSLDEEKRDFVFILSLGVAGALAHNLIDYNFNFLANLILLFIYLIFIRSVFVTKTDDNGNYKALIFAFFIGLISIYEGAFLFSEHSLFPRNHFPALANEQIAKKNFTEAMANLDYELKLNPLDAEAWHLRAVIDCGEEYILNNAKDCERDSLQALKLNSMNDFKYHLDYFKALFSGKAEVTNFSRLLTKSLEILDVYTNHVDKNVHFTAYTPNVEAAAELIDLLAKESVSNPTLFTKSDWEKINSLNSRKQKMLDTAKRLREQKTF
ncbi:O-antigen ligase family protein [Candidatus Peregrinibacteria bacterium]|nr:O-antigen ligase family protein [Candidatus Peregrinibacteria bacterium]